MFKLVVLSALLAVVAAKPSHLAYGGHSAVVAAPLAYHAPVVAHHAVAHAIPVATSHSSRVDVISKPVIHTAYAAAPLVHAAPVVHAAPLALGHAGIVGHGLGYAGAGHGLAYAGHGLGYAGHGLGYAGHGLAGHGLAYSHGLAGHGLAYGHHY